MSQSSVTKLISKLQFKLHDRRKLSTPKGPLGRHDKIKKTVTALFKHERIELNYHRADESRGYAERLISDAIRYGDCHRPTMEMASYWIIEKPIIHKLFKVLAPRYQNLRVSYTKLWRAPNVYPGIGYPKAVLELRNNIYPPLGPDKSYVKNQIHNVLLEAAKEDYLREKALKQKAEANENKGESQCDMGKNIKVVDTNINSDRTTTTDKESELNSEKNLKADNVNKSESDEKNMVDLSLEKDLDLDKIKITEEKQTDSVSEGEKK